MRIIDVSSYQGAIDWNKVSNVPDLAGAIIRTTTKNGKLDTAAKANYEGIVKNFNAHFNGVAGYKFSYVRSYYDARIEAFDTINTLNEAGIKLDMLYLDLEGFDNRDYTTREADSVILGYLDQCALMGVKLGLYFNYNYAKHIVNDRWKVLPLWIARYNKTLGDVSPWKPHLWQYTSTGRIDGINGNVDISEVLQ